MKYLKALVFITLFSSATLVANAAKLNLFFDQADAKIELNENAYSSVDEAKEMIENIIAVVGLKPKFEIKEANIPNAAAVIYGSKRYVLYNSGFVQRLNRAAGNKWASVSILAHEIGHHLNGHTLERGGSRPEIELEADEFSGFVLRKMGATLPQAQVAMKVAASQKASHTHPAQKDRLYAIAKGWNNANKQAGSTDESLARKYEKPDPVTTPARERTDVRQNVQERSSTPQIAIAEEFIAKDVVINNNSYHITTRNNFIKVNGNQVYVLGKLTALDNAGFPYAIIDNKKNFMLVKNDGNIFDRNGRRVGFLRNRR